ncbi:MAG: deoxyribose-phosphate aldolase [Candidatus Cloacimonetes bacterium]|nr:deoxyribose-phosphate aldolase [Candidatus Cloacimonadota bacterium]
MLDVKQVAIELWPLDESKLAKCKGSHIVCLKCPVCFYTKNNYALIKTPKQRKDIAQYIDHTLLKPEAKTVEIVRLCQEARLYEFASVCVNPYYISLAKKEMDKRTVCSVVGFPLGANVTHAKLEECKKALADGATEIDMVINIGELKDKGYNYIFSEIEEIAEICHYNNALLKVIIETCVLSDEEKVIACLLAKKAGADFVKTSTGFARFGATIKDVTLMREVVGNYMGVKAAGGIRDWQKAKEMISAGANRIGVSASLQIIGG